MERVQTLAAQWLGAGRHDDMAIVVISVLRAGPRTPCPHKDDSRPG
ncbi:hypothetical protein [Streptomyces anandii]|nr:hypothetical protein [Streptomyces anandii]